MSPFDTLRNLLAKAFPPCEWWRTSNHSDGKCDIRAMHIPGGTVSIESARVGVAGCGEEKGLGAAEYLTGFWCAGQSRVWRTRAAAVGVPDDYPTAAIIHE